MGYRNLNMRYQAIMVRQPPTGNFRTELQKTHPRVRFLSSQRKSRFSSKTLDLEVSEPVEERSRTASNWVRNSEVQYLLLPRWRRQRGCNTQRNARHEWPQIQLSYGKRAPSCEPSSHSRKKKNEKRVSWRFCFVLVNILGGQVVDTLDNIRL